MNNKKISLLFFIFLMFTGTLFGEYGYPTEAFSQKNIFGYPKKMSKTLKKYISLAENNTGSYLANWKVAELAYYLSEYLMFENNVEAAKKILEIGVKYAKKSMKINLNGIEGNAYLISNLGIYSDIKGPQNMIPEVIIEAKKVMERLRNIDKNMSFQKGFWGRYMGRFFISLPPPPQSFGDLSKGIGLLKSVEKIYPTFTNKNYLAMGYMVVGNFSEAGKLLKGNCNQLLKSDLSIYVNRRELAFCKSFLSLIKERNNKDRLSILEIIKHKYDYPPDNVR